MELILLGILTIAAVGLIVYSVMPKGDDAKGTVRRRLSGKAAGGGSADIQEAARKQANEELVKKATPVLNRLVMPVTDEEQTELKAKLIQAGIRNPNAQTIFLGSKTALGVAGLIFGIIVATSTAQPLVQATGIFAFFGGGGFMLPNLWLWMAIGQRKEKVRHGLPDTLDLMVVSVESGLALDAALKRVGDEMAIVHPELSEEMRICTHEGQMGIPRAEALENMARRVDIDELRSLISVIVQAEKFGTSVAKALRNQAETLRTKRRQAAEERAQKTAVKLLIPLVLFIFPALGIVLGGPAALRMIEAISSTPALQ